MSQFKAAAYNKRLNDEIKTYLKLQISILDNEDTITYSNALQLTEETTYIFINQSLNSNFSLMNNYNLRAEVTKIITLCLSHNEQSFTRCYESPEADDNEDEVSEQLIARKGLLL
jgi:hypothetical protein